jgi:hypothetical protein
VPWKPSWDDDYVHRPSLSPLDRTVGALASGGIPVGYVVFRLDRLATLLRGHLWWKRYSDPVDAVEWVEVLHPGSEYERMHDGITRIDPGFLAEMDQGVWRTNLDGEAAALELRFLSGRERDRVWSAYGWAD